LQNRHGIANLLLGRLDLVVQVDLRDILVVQLWQSWGVVKRVAQQARLENLNFLGLISMWGKKGRRKESTKIVMNTYP
jgi:hypothetical protein